MTKPMLRYTVVALVAIILFLPFIAFAINAFAFRWFYPQFIPSEFSLRAWEQLFQGNTNVWESMIVSAVIAIGVSVVSVLIGLPAARAMGLHHFRGRRLVEFLILAPTMMPPVVISLGLSINFIRLQLAGTIVGVAIVHLVPVIPYVVLTLAGVFANYNTDFEDQARSLGANPLEVLWFITLPAIFPGIVVAALFAFLISWSQYLLTLLIGQGRVVTMPFLLFSATTGANNANIAVLSLMFIGPAILILLLTSRYLGGEQSAIGGLGRV